jgi:NAD+ synthase
VADLYHAVMLGLRDYVGKNGFPGVVLGLSGGIDSALTAVIAVDALGADQVRALMLPSPYTSRESLEDAATIATTLCIHYETVPITPAMDAVGTMLGPLFAGTAPDVTEENIQSRLRGLVLMAVSNKFGLMVLTTGNKSEMAVGYATLYGDMCGGYNALKDLYKQDVFALSRWRNAHRPAGAHGPGGVVIPERVLVKPPSAELRPDQKDSDSLPPYGMLDAILRHLVDNGDSVREVIAAGFPEDTVRRVWKLLQRAEYKRRQAAPGVKVSARAFGRDWRLPLTDRSDSQ